MVGLGTLRGSSQPSFMFSAVTVPRVCCHVLLSYLLQDGSQLRLSDADRKALVFGLALHEKGKASLEAGSVQVRQHLLHLVALTPSILLRVLSCMSFTKQANATPSILLL